MSVLVTVVVMTIAISALCSLLEAALYSTRIWVVEAARASGRHKRVAERLSRMKRDISGPAASILILNTVANTAGATLAGMYAARILGASMVPAFTLGLTFAILFLAEIVPKTYGALHWHTLWPFIVWPIAAIEKALYPLTRLSRWIAHLFSGKQTAPTVTEAEIIGAIRLGAEAGEVTLGEARLLRAVFHFDEMVCRQVMVPRRDVVFFEADWPLERCMATAVKTKHTRYPVCRGSLDEVIGVAHIKDLLVFSPGETFHLTEVMRPPRRVPESMPINRLLREMQRTRQHMAIVVDEHGMTSGMITLENVLEQIVGSLQDEFDVETPEVVPDGTRRFIVKGETPLARVNEALHLDLFAPNVDTLSGLLVARLGRLPKVGDRVDLGGARAEVMEVQIGRATRIRMILPRDWKPRPED